MAGSSECLYVNRFWLKGQLISDQQFIKDDKCQCSLTSCSSVPWSPHSGLEVCSWNGKAAFPAKFTRANQKLKGISQLLSSNKITLLQETHLSRRSVSICKKLALQSSCFGFGSYGSQAAGGIYCFVQQDFLESNFDWARCDELVPGRVSKLTCSGASGTLVIYNVHLFPSCDPVRKEFLELIRADSNPNAFNVIAGDFNFTNIAADRIYYDNDYNDNTNNGNVSNQFNNIFPGYCDISQETAMTYFGPEHSARLDRLYVQLARVPANLFKIRSWVVPGFRELSDHIPVCVRISTPRRAGGKRLPETSTKHPMFAQKVREFWDTYNMTNTNPWYKLAYLKKCMYDAHRWIKKYAKPEKELFEKRLATASKFFKAVACSDVPAIHKCCADEPRLSQCYVQGIRPTIKDSFFDFWRELLLSQVVAPGHKPPHYEPHRIRIRIRIRIRS